MVPINGLNAYRNFYPLIENKKIPEIQNMPRQSFQVLTFRMDIDIVEKEQILKYDSLHGIHSSIYYR